MGEHGTGLNEDNTIEPQGNT